MAKKVLIPTKLDSVAKEILEAHGGYEVHQEEGADLLELAKQHSDAHAFIVRSEKVTPQVIDAFPELKVVIRAGAGFNTIDTAYARSKDIDVIVAWERELAARQKYAGVEHFSVPCFDVDDVTVFENDIVLAELWLGPGSVAEGDLQRSRVVRHRRRIPAGIAVVLSHERTNEGIAAAWVGKSPPQNLHFVLCVQAR